MGLVVNQLRRSFAAHLMLSSNPVLFAQYKGHLYNTPDTLAMLRGRSHHQGAVKKADHLYYGQARKQQSMWALK
jgi:hypothetical protein